MYKLLSIASTGCLTICALLTSIPTRAQLPSSQPSQTPASSSATPQPTPSETVTGNIVDKFQCSIAEIGAGEVLVRGNGYYTFNNNNGKYQLIGQGYRFVSGPLRGQSVVRYKQSIYPLATIDEAKASYLINNDSNIKSCSGSKPERTPSEALGIRS